MTRETTQFERDHAARVNVAGLLLLLAHVPVICAVAAYLGRGVLVSAVLGVLLLSGPALIILHRRDSPHGAIAIAIAAMSFSALLIHITGGLIETHFHIFTALALMVVFGRIAPLIAAGLTIALHHVLFWLWIPASVFNYEASLGMVALHAFFVVFELAPTCWIASQFGKNLWASGIVDERLQGAAQRVSAASMQLGEASEGLAQSAAKQAATLVETSASSTQVRTIAHDNARLSTDALILMEAVSQQMSEANADLEGVQGTVTEMVDSSHQIAKVIRLIDEIAFQTNILSLNASIEAARAGQFGQGFSVVANEVRSLASRSAAAVTDTALLIEGALEKARAGQRSVHELVAAMSRVTVTTGLAKGHMEKIQNASKLQTDATQLINTSLGKLERISHQTASSAGATATSGAELREQSATLRDIVAILQHA